MIWTACSAVADFLGILFKNYPKAFLSASSLVSAGRFLEVRTWLCVSVWGCSHVADLAMCWKRNLSFWKLKCVLCNTYRTVGSLPLLLKVIWISRVCEYFSGCQSGLIIIGLVMSVTLKYKMCFLLLCWDFFSIYHLIFVRFNKLPMEKVLPFFFWKGRGEDEHPFVFRSSEKTAAVSERAVSVLLECQWP